VPLAGKKQSNQRSCCPERELNLDGFSVSRATQHLTGKRLQEDAELFDGTGNEAISSIGLDG
jgi:hypothetical protein